MPKRRKKKIVRTIHPSVDPLPQRLAAQFADRLQVFSDASQKRHGGLAAVMFTKPESEALVFTKTVPLMGSNELELQAALFALAQANEQFPGQVLALFSDNLDAVTRLNRYKSEGSDQDKELVQMLIANELPSCLDHATICWIKGHASCRGNLLADQHAVLAAS